MSIRNINSNKDEKFIHSNSTEGLEQNESSTGYIDDLESQTEKDIADELQQGLKARHIQLIALGGTIGTGLFVGSGAALSSCGPAGLLTAYLIMSIVIYFIMNQLGEMVCYLPTKGGAISDIVQRYVDESLGFATGWIYYYTFIILVCTEVTAASIVIDYWTDKVHIAVWITIFLLVIIGLNFLAVKYYGEAEFWFSSLKIICILGLIILGIVIFFGGGPNQTSIRGFQYWNNPGAFAEHLSSGNTGRFLDVWTGVIKSGFAFITGPELVAIAAAETKNPRRNISKAARRFVYRLMFFYVIGSLVIGIMVPSNNKQLLNGSSTASASPFVIGIQNVGIKGLNHVINGAILTSAWSSGNSFFYASTRSLLSLAKAGKAPKIFLKINRFGVPWVACSLSAAIGCLSYLNVSSGSAKVFTWFTNISTISGFIGWIIIGIAYLRWRKAVLYNDLWDRVPFKTYLQPYGAYFSISLISLICLTNGYATFFDFNGPDFIAAYITLPVFFGLYLGHKIFTKNWKLCYPIDEVDVISGLDRAEKVSEIAQANEDIPTTWYGKFWSYLM
ncbi:Proline-specific permease [Wickerhamomyces ciferrii]|uniref:Proline-specific permease n=1 Tax=Wickerhamomyces ciferrii (strain ATCC 14091 / BCRC 22168 / CBS 111 / JCM 3599 / NBRC 0793 / NRRL Y-1031 F-60-10) TaxID=1206466 RepID=K0KD08_WICCF|nr:Proline-specific permease [Wickerhamomyces ciferrii]CCH42990.1 Proline-specific permease [Wickerhamomyces ciferrii]